MYAAPSSSSSLLSDLRVADLVRGEGEWRNLQPVVRGAFKQLNDTVDRQQTQIRDLCDVCVALKTQLASRPTIDDVKQLLADEGQRASVASLLGKSGPTSGKGVSIGGSANCNDVLSLSARLEELRVDVQRKASVQYVDDVQRRKLDRSEAVVRHLVDSEKEVRNMVRTCVQEETRKLHEDLGVLQSQHDRAVGRLNEAARDQQGAVQLRQSVAALTIQLQQLEQRSYGTDEAQRQKAEMQRRAWQTDLEQQLVLKADRSALCVAMGAVEKALADHERQLTSLRLRPFATGVGLTVEDDCLEQEWGAQEEVINEKDGIIGTGTGELFAARLKGSRDEVLVQSLWTRMQAMGRELARVKAQQKDDSSRLGKAEIGLSECAGAAQAEALSVILEEQKLRLDALIQGQILINPVQRQIDALSTFAGIGTLNKGATTLRDLLDEQRRALENTQVQQEAISLGLDATGQRLASLEGGYERLSRLVAAVEKGRREGEVDFTEELSKVKGKVDTIIRILQQKEKREMGERDRREAMSAVGAGMDAGDTGIGEGAVGATGSAAVDARLAVLHAEKARLRQQL